MAVLQKHRESQARHAVDCQSAYTVWWVLTYHCLARCTVSLDTDEIKNLIIVYALISIIHHSIYFYCCWETRLFLTLNSTRRKNHELAHRSPMDPMRIFTRIFILHKKIRSKTENVSIYMHLGNKLNVELFSKHLTTLHNVAKNIWSHVKPMQNVLLQSHNRHKQLMYKA
jgi:hypothetical protein